MASWRGKKTAKRRKALAWLAALVAVLLLAPRASAHTIGLSTGEYVAKGSSLTATLAFARAEIATVAPAVDANGDGHLTPAEIQASRALLESKLLARIVVSAGGAACPATLTDAALTEQDGLLVMGRWDCASSGAPFELDVALLDDLARGHRHVARVVTGDATHDEVLDATRRELTIAPEPAAAGSPGVERSSSERRSGARPGSAAAFLVMGVEHILTGYDHLVFLLGLVLVRARARTLLGVVTAFTVAHSITLALAALGVWAPSPRIVEPAIALSIAYVGIENFFVEDATKRWRITFPFGLVHGFGFAGALQEVALPRGAVPAALVSFNLGVEAGQLLVLALLLPAIAALRRTDWFEPRGARLASGAVALAGALWFVTRVWP